MHKKSIIVLQAVVFYQNVLFFQALFPSLKKAADRKAGPQLGVSKAAVVNISAGNGSLTTAMYPFPVIDAAVGYRVSKVCLDLRITLIKPYIDNFTLHYMIP